MWNGFISVEKHQMDFGGKLDACNYATARCAHLVKQSVSGDHSGTGYWEQTLSFMEMPLQKKKYGTT